MYKIKQSPKVICCATAGGLKPDGVPFPETMPWQASKMNDDDLAALYAYLVAPMQ